MPERLVLDPESEDLPKRKDLPEIAGAPDGAAWVWGERDEVDNLQAIA